MRMASSLSTTFQFCPLVKEGLRDKAEAKFMRTLGAQGKVDH
jgi:hypothetical protein